MNVHLVYTESTQSNIDIHRVCTEQLLVYTESTQSHTDLHRVYKERCLVYTESTQSHSGSTQNLHRAKESYTESTQSNSEPKRLYKAFAGSTHSVMQYYRSKQSKIYQIFDEFHLLFLTIFIFFFLSILSIIILNSLHLKMFPLHFYHHPQQFTSQQHSASNSFRTSDLEVMRPAFSHWAALPVHIKSWKVLYLISGFVIQKLELLIQ